MDIPVVPVVPPTPVAPPVPVVPSAPIPASVIQQYTNLLVSLLDGVLLLLPAQVKPTVEVIDLFAHSVIAQPWFTDLIGVIVNAIHGGTPATQSEIFGVVLNHILKSGDYNVKVQSILFPKLAVELPVTEVK